MLKNVEDCLEFSHIVTALEHTTLIKRGGNESLIFCLSYYLTDLRVHGVCNQIRGWQKRRGRGLEGRLQWPLFSQRDPLHDSRSLLLCHHSQQIRFNVRYFIKLNKTTFYTWNLFSSTITTTKNILKTIYRLTTSLILAVLGSLLAAGSVVLSALQSRILDKTNNGGLDNHHPCINPINSTDPENPGESECTVVRLFQI